MIFIDKFRRSKDDIIVCCITGNDYNIWYMNDVGVHDLFHLKTLVLLFVIINMLYKVNKVLSTEKRVIVFISFTLQRVIT